MELGSGIFLSAVFLGTIGLYIATRDRWKWKRISIWVAGGMALLLVATGGGLGLYSYWQDNKLPAPQFQLWGIELGASKSDVKFLKGIPDFEDPSHWIYYGTNGRNDSYVVAFRDDKVRSVAFYGSKFEAPSIDGISLYQVKSTLARMGEPSHVARSEDETQRIYCYDKFQLCFHLKGGEPEGIAVFNPTHGPLKFTKQAGPEAKAKRFTLLPPEDSSRK